MQNSTPIPTTRQNISHSLQIDASTQTDAPEEKIHSLVQENLRLETELARARATIAQMQTGLFSRTSLNPTTPNTALDARIAALEQKIQSIRDENHTIEADLAHCRNLYLQKQQGHQLNKTTTQELAPLEEEIKRLNTAIATQSTTNFELSQKIITETAVRNYHRTIWTNAMIAVGAL